MTEKIKIGVIGCGVGRNWVVGAAQCEDTTAWAVADLDRQLAQQIEEEVECHYDGNDGCPNGSVKR